MKTLFCCFLIIISLSNTVDAELGSNARIIFAHHSMGALLIGNRTYTKPRGFAEPEAMHLCRRLDVLNEGNKTRVRIFHHDRDIWNSLRDCENGLIESSWGKIAMWKDGNTPTHWHRLFIENEWPDVRAKLLRYDVLVIKNSYQTVQDEHSPGYEEDPDGAYTIIEKMDEWKGYLRELALYFAEKHPDKILVHLGSAPRRGLKSEGSGIHYATREVADASREFAQWMAVDWVAMAPNIRYFPWFEYLANADNVMDERWRGSGSHYQPWRGTEIGLVLADYIYNIATRNDVSTIKNQ